MFQIPWHFQVFQTSGHPENITFGDPAYPGIILKNWQRWNVVVVVVVVSQNSEPSDSRIAARFLRSASTCICMASCTRDGNLMSPVRQHQSPVSYQPHSSASLTASDRWNQTSAENGAAIWRTQPNQTKLQCNIMMQIMIQKSCVRILKWHGPQFDRMALRPFFTLKKFHQNPSITFWTILHTRQQTPKHNCLLQRRYKVNTNT